MKVRILDVVLCFVRSVVCTVLGSVFWLGCVDFCSVVCKWSLVVCSFGKNFKSLSFVVVSFRNSLNVDMICVIHNSE